MVFFLGTTRRRTAPTQPMSRLRTALLASLLGSHMYLRHLQPLPTLRIRARHTFTRGFACLELLHPVKAAATTLWRSSLSFLATERIVALRKFEAAVGFCLVVVEQCTRAKDVNWAAARSSLSAVS